ncbi:hypothetical protein [Proteiniphilum sp.]|uniref:hypothetical protein n=1 Tax=Proteiniphilum sp. TaxID=1926877 RepID=UPI002B218ABC|nr:hypothetical protein [Proteiniphilum sp.]MEA4917240.1 hypothetical protein [Proteiniphilum sp.]
MDNYLNKTCNSCIKFDEYETKLNCRDVAEKEIFDIFRRLDVPMNEQAILVRTINRENICWSSFKSVLSNLIRHK